MLPQTKRMPKQKLEDYKILLYGSPKIGKSTFCSQMEKPLFLATEPGLNALEVYEVKVTDWSTFLNACAEISKSNHSFKTIVIDTVDNLFKGCQEYVRQKNGIAHESDMPYGKGWELLKSEFFRPLRKLSMLDVGLVMTSHVKMVEVKTRTSVYHKAVPTIPTSGRDIIEAWVDIILFAESVVDIETGEIRRVLHTQPSDLWIAGDRTEHAFKRKLPSEIDLDFTTFSKEFYKKGSR
jgi:GTPase SAR1 family protein